MSKHLGKIVAVNGNMIRVKFRDHIIQNEVGYVLIGDKRLSQRLLR